MGYKYKRLYSTQRNDGNMGCFAGIYGEMRNPGAHLLIDTSSRCRSYDDYAVQSREIMDEMYSDDILTAFQGNEEHVADAYDKGLVHMTPDMLSVMAHYRCAPFRTFVEREGALYVYDTLKDRVGKMGAFMMANFTVLDLWDDTVKFGDQGYHQGVYSDTTLGNLVSHNLRKLLVWFPNHWDLYTHRQTFSEHYVTPDIGRQRTLSDELISLAGNAPSLSTGRGLALDSERVLAIGEWCQALHDNFDQACENVKENSR